jgi:hypothetical protein
MVVEFSISTKPTQQFMDRSRKAISSEAKSERDRGSSALRLSITSSEEPFMMDYLA